MRSARGPSDDVVIGGAADRDLSAPTYQRALAEIRRRLRRCHTSGGEGAIRLDLRIASDGEVLTISASSPHGLGDAEIACMIDAPKGVRFPAPLGGGDRLVVPVTFRGGGRR